MLGHSETFLQMADIPLPKNVLQDLEAKGLVSGNIQCFSGLLEPPVDAAADIGASSEQLQSKDIIQDGSKVCIVSTGDWFSFGTVAPGR